MSKTKKMKKYSLWEAKQEFTKKRNVVKSGSNHNITESNINIASICHKQSHGANNWTSFKESLLKQKEPNKPKTHNNETTHHNRINKAIPVHKLSEQCRNQSHSKSVISSKIRVNKAIPVTKVNEHCTNDSKSTSNITYKKTLTHDLKCEEDKSVVGLNGNKYLVKKQYQSADHPLTKHIAIDCEMVGVEIGVNSNMLARVSLVNSFGDCIYDKFVKPTEEVLHYRTHVSGIRSENLENAEDFKIVQKEVANIIKGSVLIGHALKNDLKVLFLTHPRQAIRDTSKFKKFREGRTPSLKKLAMKYLGVSIQEGEHSSVQDALAAMQLYRMFKKEWEANLKPLKFAIKKKRTEISNSEIIID